MYLNHTRYYVDTAFQGSGIQQRLRLVILPNVEVFGLNLYSLVSILFPANGVECCLTNSLTTA